MSKHAMIPMIAAATLLCTMAAASAGQQQNGANLNGTSFNGVVLNGISVNGVSLNGVALNGLTARGIESQGKPAAATGRLVPTRLALPDGTVLLLR
ncbi:hypothetical protein [Paracraurococcus lichenis]|uniref:Pentapeptide repeat-containing protein n=1 Tax=Paracraurococcus lichenis TaxID=3064888 RepID=A0ABT9EB76_9PROT|nr:hypothetical protein [Paracraurococcus sp. LOR1-02]MDO9713354.1 hypothetical protein [Paracraurococcus sp. LOR1-02]